MSVTTRYQGEQMIDVGVIGVGAMGRHHARVYSELESVRLVGVSDVNEKRLVERSPAHTIRDFIQTISSSSRK